MLVQWPSKFEGLLWIIYLANISTIRSFSYPISGGEIQLKVETINRCVIVSALDRIPRNVKSQMS